jgi:hypothetical protein
MDKKFTPVTLKHSYQYMGSTDFQIEPLTPWNYGLIADAANPASSFEVVTNPVGKYPFGDHGDLIYNPSSNGFDTLNQNPPVVLKVKAKKVPAWVMNENNAGLTPYSPVQTSEPEETIDLIPYGAARLRVTEFPWIK